MKEKKYYVYIHVNRINKKVYVGITSKTPRARWGAQGGQYCNTTEQSKKTKFQLAIEKYGWDNFEHRVLFFGLTAEEAKQKEKELINFYDSYNNGYNMTVGGDGGGFLGKHHSEATKLKIAKPGTLNPMYGTHRPDYVKEAVRKAHAKSVSQYSLQGELIRTYESATEVKRLFGYDNSLINKCCKLKHRTAYGYYWRYSEEPFNI